MLFTFQKQKGKTEGKTNGQNQPILNKETPRKVLKYNELNI